MKLPKWKILNIVDNRSSFNKVLELSSISEATVIKCRLKSQWYSTPTAIGQIVYIRAKQESDEMVIDEKFGYICLYPDTLISGTTVVGSLFCRRKGILQQKFGQLDGANKYVSKNIILFGNKLLF